MMNKSFAKIPDATLTWDHVRHESVEKTGPAGWKYVGTFVGLFFPYYPHIPEPDSEALPQLGDRFFSTALWLKYADLFISAW